MFAIRLPIDIRRATGRNKTFYARAAILEHLDELEDLYLAEQRLIDNRAGRSQTRTGRKWSARLDWRIEFDAGALPEFTIRLAALRSPLRACRGTDGNRIR